MPAGTYLITSANPKILSTTAARARGLSFRGAGRGITKILFKPESGTNGYLFYNDDKWLHLHFEGITFIGDVDKQTNFMYSYSTGGAQNYTYDKCDFIHFNYGWELKGLNTNSEFTWFHCGFYGKWNKTVFSDITGTSDQFLNYNFYSCQVEFSYGEFLYFAQGGNINIWGGSFINTADSGVHSTFFKLLGTSHSSGVQRFLCIGARIETKYGLSKIIECEWASGTVSFISCDCDAQQYNSGSQLWITAIFKSVNTKMPIVKFDACTLMGIHQYSYTGNSWSQPHNIIYENCQIAKHNKAQDFISYVSTNSLGNLGGQPQIIFRNCRGLDDNQSIVWESTLGFMKANVGMVQKKIVSLKGANGRFPISGSTNFQVVLPMNSIITEVKLYSPANAVTETNPATFTLKTAGESSTVLAVADVSSHKDGFDVSQSLFFICDTADKCKISLIAGSSVTHANPSALCLIEYIE
ncbi:hypothetical protein SAMN04487969_11620 [Paenibacillus algorifonticola]|uniref:Right handed beta helix region n=1 Tax=Paenibacillus algorifonticola TaxID=684063 RepID=A0A1I2GG59_9BACL|nr:hypothetical protein [Paenibacillus algorifonticola]SFF16492.1 hypothetical protein SAMN04487969_11620 [Paenibacillus algorifonticola]